MAFGGAPGNGLLPGPWDTQPREGSPLWGWSGDEETLLLLTAEVAKGETQEPERVLTGPWERKSLNPFETDMWSPFSAEVVGSADHNMSLANISSPKVFQEEGPEICNQYLCPLLPLWALIPVTAVCLALLVFGLGGNILTIVVTSCSRQLRNTTSLYLASLAVSDLLLLLLGLPLDLYRLWQSRPWVLGTVVCRVWHWSGEACAYCSILHLTALTAERYVAICYPLRAKVLVTEQRVKALLVVLWAVALFSAAPFLFLVGVQQAGKDDFTRECVPTIYARETGMLDTMLWVTTSYFVLPCLCLYVLHGLIARQLLRVSRAHLGGTSYRNHRQTVRMLARLQPSHSRWRQTVGPGRQRTAAEAAAAGPAMAEGEARASGRSAPARTSLPFQCLERLIAVEGGGSSHDGSPGQAQPPGTGMSTLPHALSQFSE
nr:growth hormone secretagogue receptor type 1-like [Pogona vitticeps]